MTDHVPEADRLFRDNWQQCGAEIAEVLRTGRTQGLHEITSPNNIASETASAVPWTKGRFSKSEQLGGGIQWQVRWSSPLETLTKSTTIEATKRLQLIDEVTELALAFVAVERTMIAQRLLQSSAGEAATVSTWSQLAEECEAGGQPFHLVWNTTIVDAPELDEKATAERLGPGGSIHAAAFGVDVPHFAVPHKSFVLYIADSYRYFRPTASEFAIESVYGVEVQTGARITRFAPPAPTEQAADT